MINLVYIASPSYSGSTLLTLLLGAHPQIATVGELKATAMGDVDLYQCSCGSPIRRCHFWGTVAESLKRRNMQFDLADFGTHFRLARESKVGDRLLRARVRGPLLEGLRSAILRLHPWASDRARRVLERNRTLIETLCELRGTSTFLDGSKDPIRLMHLLRSQAWRVKVIHLIRDGRGTANSYMKHYRANMTVAAFEWRDTHQECERIKRTLGPAASFTMRYEDLCSDPRGAMEALLAFIGVDPSRITLDLRSPELHVLGNAMRLRSADEIRTDERWRIDLSTQELALFDRLVGNWNTGYGYV
jgi:hypothetical protein